jgi:outer membrane protein assembly factor BamB/tRNA A-37 threonylcarbamoyl transferase component Bud32
MSDSTQKFSGSLIPGQSRDVPVAPPEGALQPGSVLQNRYRIQTVLGVGGMGSVYLARDQRFTNVIRHVAVKEMLNMQSDPQMREITLKNFAREADVLASMSHPAVPQIYDVFAGKDRAYLVMEYIDGQDLEAFLSRTPELLDPSMVRNWAIQLCDVLQYLHSHQPDPIIFRDMKPSNIMIDKSRRIRLIDFGIAKPFQPQSMIKGTMIGTDGYAPPEQYRGQASPQGDIFALGATLHHLLTRKDPRLEAPFSFNQRPIRQINPRVPPAFEAIIMQALSENPAQRFQTAQAMKDALEAITTRNLGAQNTTARPGAGPAGYGGTTDLTANAPGAGFAEGADTFETEDTGIKPVWKFKVEDEIRSSPVFYKGSVYIGAYDNNLYAFNATDGKPKLKYATKDGIPGTPAIAADENLIIFGSEDHNLYAMDTRSNKVSWEFKTDAPIRSSITVAHGHAFFGSDDGRLYAVRASTGRASWKYESGAPIRSRPAASEDKIIFANEQGDMIGLDLSGGIKWRFKAKRAITGNITVFDGIAYAGSQDFHIYAVDIQAGWAAWRFRTQKPVISSPCIEGKFLYIGSADGFLYALDLNGREVWKFKTEGQIVSTPAYFNSAVYFGCTDHKVYSVDAKKGIKRWEFVTDGPITSSPTIVDSIVYIGSTDQYLYALNA